MFFVFLNATMFYAASSLDFKSKFAKILNNKKGNLLKNSLSRHQRQVTLQRGKK